MQIDGIAGSVFKDMVQPKQQQTQSVTGPSFMESIKDFALRTDMVVRGNQLGAAGLSERKMVEDRVKGLKTEEEESLDDIFKKLGRIEEILKEKFSK